MSERRQLINLAYRLLGSLAEPHLPQPARLGPGPARDLRGRMDPRAAARTYGAEHWAAGRPGGTTIDPADRITFDESVNMAFLVVL
jgi:RNA polymerase sigma-70 factor (ECF subfamily)